MAQLILYLSSKPENLGSDLLQPHKKPGVAVYICDSRDRNKDRRIPCACWPASLTQLMSSMFNERL